MILDLAGALFLGMLAFCILLWSWKKGFFFIENEFRSIPLRWFHPVSVFAIHLGVVSLIQPFLILSLKKTASAIAFIGIAAWAAFLVSLLVIFAIIFYCYFLPREIPLKIWRFSKKTTYLQDAYSALICICIAYPLVLFSGQLFDLLLYFFFHIKQLPDQTAVLFLKMTLGHPFYFFLTLITVIVLAPCLEEILFRGFLQSFIKQHLNTKLSIFISALCFALFHYAPEQGIANVSIVGSIFILALFLGFIYEKRGSLIAPIVLHASFNTINVINLYLLEGFSKTGS